MPARAKKIELLRSPYKNTLKGRTIGFAKSGLPSGTFVKLRFRQSGLYQLTSGVGNAFVFRGNGAFDPYAGAGGVTPAEWSTYQALYNDYRCYGSQIRVKCINNHSLVQKEVTVVPAMDAAFTSFAAAQAHPTASPLKICAVLSAGGNIKNFKRYADTAAVMGCSKEIVRTENDYGANTSSTPVKQWYWHIWQRSLDHVTSGDLYIKVEIIYYVYFCGRKEQSAPS